MFHSIEIVGIQQCHFGSGTEQGVFAMLCVPILRMEVVIMTCKR